MQRATHTRTDWRSSDYLSKRILVRDLRECREYVRGRTLDVGCGNKPYLEIFAGRATAYVGLDPDPRGSRPDVVGTATELPFAAETFETVVATQVLEHVTDPSGMLVEIRRVLVRGGHMILTAPQYWPLHEEPQDYFRFTRYGLTHLVTGSGLAIVQLKPQGGAATLVGQALCNTLQSRRRWRRLVPAVNLLFAALERAWIDGSDPLNYLVVARRPEALPAAPTPPPPG